MIVTFTGLSLVPSCRYVRSSWPSRGYRSGFQAEEHGTPSQLRELLYKLAHRLIVSSPTPSYINSERFHLHLSILLKLDLIDDAHKLLDSSVGRNICATNLSCNELRREVWKLKGLVQEEGDLAKSLLLDKKYALKVFYPSLS
jgi:N-terminal acetyltransferase B complex non-catalytic subunit